MEGQKVLGFHQKYHNLCSEDERRSYGFGTTWGWVINDRILIIGWTIPLKSGLLLAVFPGLSQALLGDFGHSVRPQEAPGSPSAVRAGFLTGVRQQSRRHPLHHQEVHRRDREKSAENEGTFRSSRSRPIEMQDCADGPPLCQGIYRVNGVKTRVEKLCQAFENGKELVELSQSSPHDISNVLKLYLRQVSHHCIRTILWKCHFWVLYILLYENFKILSLTILTVCIFGSPKCN